MTDYILAREHFRQCVLDALDKAARDVLADEYGFHPQGWTDADVTTLRALFDAVDQHVRSVAEREGIKLEGANY
jgi:hypothetical protein